MVVDRILTLARACVYERASCMHLRHTACAYVCAYVCACACARACARSGCYLRGWWPRSTHRSARARRLRQRRR
eukprot:6189684-Pleurochrysis_carterae.AAC.1